MRRGVWEAAAPRGGGPWMPPNPIDLYGLVASMAANPTNLYGFVASIAASPTNLYGLVHDPQGEGGAAALDDLPAGRRAPLGEQRQSGPEDPAPEVQKFGF